MRLDERLDGIVFGRLAARLLEILERKTEGRRTPEEDQILAGLLYELRMAYLARAR